MFIVEFVVRDSDLNKAVGAIALKEGDTYYVYDVIPLSLVNSAGAGMAPVKLVRKYEEKELVLDEGVYDHEFGQIQASSIEDDEDDANRLEIVIFD